MSLSGDSYEVIGVLSASFNSAQFDPFADVWTPFQMDPASVDQAHYFTAAARLKPGVTLAMVDTQLRGTADQFRSKFPNMLGPQASFGVQLLQERVVRNVRTSLLVLVGAVSFVLLIACANVANLLLVRATGRKREIAIRAAMGAARGRIVRQLLTENVLLSIAGGALGLGLGMAGIRALLAVNPGNIPRIGADGSGVTADWRVVAFTITVSLATGLVFGLFPALEASRADLNLTLKESGGRAGSGFRQNKARSILVVAEVALALVLLIGASLLIRSFVALRAVESRVRVAQHPDHADVADRAEVRDGRRRRSGRPRGRRALRALPGVEAAATSCCVPLEGGFGLPFNIVGRPVTARAVHRRGWMDHELARVLRRVQDPAAARPRFHGARRRRRPRRGDHQPGDGPAYWPQGDPLREQILIGKGMGPAFVEGPGRSSASSATSATGR